MTTQTAAQQLEQAYRAREEANAIIKKGTQVGDSLGGGGDVAGQVTDVRYPGSIPMWDTETGVMSECLPYMYDNRVRARKPNGLPAFTFTDPGIRKPMVGGFKCYLHPEAEGAEALFEMGFMPCMKAHIPSMSALEAHMRHHSQAWETIKRREEDKRRDEDRQFQRNQALLMQRLLGGDAAPVEPPKAPSPEPADEEVLPFPPKAEASAPTTDTSGSDSTSDWLAAARDTAAQNAIIEAAQAKERDSDSTPVLDSLATTLGAEAPKPDSAPVKLGEKDFKQTCTCGETITAKGYAAVMARMTKHKRESPAHE